MQLAEANLIRSYFYVQLISFGLIFGGELKLRGGFMAFKYIHLNKTQATVRITKFPHAARLSLDVNCLIALN